MIDNELIKSYTDAKYIVDNNDMPIRLRVGELNTEIESILEQHGTQSAYFITPENPFSQQLSKQENTLRHERFQRELSTSQFSYLKGYGCDEAEEWPKEASYLIFSNDDDSMRNLAAHFGQNAFLKCEFGSVIQLMVIMPAKYLAM